MSPTTHDAEALLAQARTWAGGLRALDLPATGQVAPQFSRGHHGPSGSRRAGAGDEFWQYRPAHDGDSAARIDWRRSARGDGLLVRERERTGPPSLVLGVAAGPEMDIPIASPARTRQTRWHLAAALALGVGALALRGGLRTGILPPPDFGNNSGGRGDFCDAHQSALAALGQRLVLQKQHPDGVRPASQDGRADYGVVIAGLMADPEPVVASLKAAAARGIRGVLAQLLTAEEASFSFDEPVILHAPSGGAAMTLDQPAAIRAVYLERLNAHLAAIDAQCRAAGWQHLVLQSRDEPRASLSALTQSLGHVATGRAALSPLRGRL